MIVRFEPDSDFFVKHNRYARLRRAYPSANTARVTRAYRLLNHVTNSARAHGAAAFTNREAQPFLHRDRRDQLNLHLHVVAGHHHLHSLRQVRDAPPVPPSDGNKHAGRTQQKKGLSPPLSPLTTPSPPAWTFGGGVTAPVFKTPSPR